MRGLMRYGALAFVVCGAHAGDDASEAKPRRFQIEVLYTRHVNVVTDENLERIRALVMKAYPDAKFEEVSIEDRRTYYGMYRDRLLKMAGTSRDDVTQKLREEEKDATPADDTVLREKVFREGYVITKDQVGREVALRAIYRFLHAQAKDDVSLKEIFEKLKAKDDPKNPVCATEPGKGLIVYLDGSKARTLDELQEIEDSGVKFGFSFRPRVTTLGDTDLPKMSPKADTLGDEGDGRQIFRLIAVVQAPGPPPDRK